jgi:hypothetical protein
VFRELFQVFLSSVAEFNLEFSALNGKMYIFLMCLCFTAVNEFRKPKIKQPLLPTSVLKNEMAVLTLVLTADPLPDVKWSVETLFTCDVAVFV